MSRMVGMFQDHYWTVGDRPGQVWSSAAGAYLPADDPRVPSGDLMRHVTIASEADLDALLREHGLASPVVSAVDVRAEASRRMQRLLGARDANHLEILISNGLREAVRLLRVKEGRPWTEDEAQRAAQLAQIDAAFEAVRAASNIIELALPHDFADDRHWPALGVA